MELPIDDVSARRLAETNVPERTEPLVLRVTALCTRPMTSRERRRLVKEKELGVRVWPHDGAVSAAELEPAG